MRGLITSVNDNHVDNCLKEILAFVHYGSIVNSRPKNSREDVYTVPQSQHIAYQWETAIKPRQTIHKPLIKERARQLDPIPQNKVITMIDRIH